ncbi:SDR family oxidoreductase [Kitasatospora viridis]|uniref:Nucleoside-diphosphate-sugar epimerase n=1 Tax=Kitasatospora viridis TaxID=281105 RepID=A0A561UFV1_9ACTN|nr:SDR family oxidoreductase [Kitasatospora viridis]TWF98230.1 nucleoside-diphosphate-sugar epimerase [Kitasatospora viridis]
MRVFITGASGFIGSAVVPLLLAEGHHVLALARSDASAAKLAAAGVEVLRGDLADPASLGAGAAASDGVVHLAFNHDFSQFADSAQTEYAAVEAYGEALAGTGKPLLMASGVLGIAPGRIATEQDGLDLSASPRSRSMQLALELADRGVRSALLRLAPCVHDRTRAGFASVLAQIARETGVSGYLGEGTAHWPAVHVRDTADLVVRALDRAPAGAVLHAVAEQGITQRAVAEALADRLGIPLRSIPADQAASHFRWLAPMLALDSRADNTLTRETYGWEPVHPTLLDDLREGEHAAPGGH